MNLKDHLEKLEYFWEISKLGSFRAASNSLHITQPSLSKAIKILESQIDKTLFIRKAKGVSLTQEGEILARYCENLFSSLRSVEQKLESPNNPHAGLIRVGTYDSIAIYFWPKFLKQFLKKYPKVKINIQTGRSKEIQQALVNQEIDLALIIEPRPEANIEVKNLKLDSFSFYETTKVQKSYEKLQDAPLIMMSDAIASSNQSSLGQVLEQLNIQNKTIYKTSSLESAKEFAIYGLGLALLPNMVAKNAVKDKKLKVIKIDKSQPKSFGKHNVGVSYLNNTMDSEIFKILFEELQKHDWE